jgi:LysM repeat protein
MERPSRVEEEANVEKDEWEISEEDRKIFQKQIEELLNKTNPLNQEKKITAEEMESLYELSSHRRRTIKRNKNGRIVNMGITILGVVLIMGIVVLTFTYIGGLYNQQKQKMMTEARQEVEILNKQLNGLKLEKVDLKKQVEDLSYENVQLHTKVQELENQLKEKNSQQPIESDQTAVNQPIQVYVVQSGDTLWKISEKVYGSGRYYKKIMEYNNIQSLDNIKRGMQLKIPKL